MRFFEHQFIDGDRTVRFFEHQFIDGLRTVRFFEHFQTYCHEKPCFLLPCRYRWTRARHALLLPMIDTRKIADKEPDKSSSLSVKNKSFPHNSL
jgi:hypothetical protein